MLRQFIAFNFLEVVPLFSVRCPRGNHFCNNLLRFCIHYPRCAYLFNLPFCIGFKRFLFWRTSIVKWKYISKLKRLLFFHSLTLSLGFPFLKFFFLCVHVKKVFLSWEFFYSSRGIYQKCSSFLCLVQNVASKLWQPNFYCDCSIAYEN